MIVKVDIKLAPRIVYTAAQMGKQQRVFILGGLNSKLKTISDEVFEIVNWS